MGTQKGVLMPIICSLKKDLACLNIKKKDWLRLESFTRKTPICWLYERGANRGGYGLFSFDCITVQAHRLSLIKVQGMPPSRHHFACHKCRQRNCINPDHLYWGAEKQNRLDSHADGTHLRPTCVGTENIKSILSENQVREILNAYFLQDQSFTSIAKLYPVSKTTVRLIARNMAWQHLDRSMYKDFDKRKMPRLGERVVTSKITEDTVKKIVCLLMNGSLSQRDIAEKFGVNQSVISNIKRRKTWAHLTDKSLPDSIRHKKLTWNKVKKIREAYRLGSSGYSLAKIYECSDRTIYDILKNRTWVVDSPSLDDRRPSPT